MEYCWKYSVSTEASSEARQGHRLERRWCWGQCCRQGDFFHKFCSPFPPVSFSTPLLHSMPFLKVHCLVFFLGDLSINENQCLQGCFYFAVNTIPLLPSCHSGTVKGLVAGIYYIYSQYGSLQTVTATNAGVNTHHLNYTNFHTITSYLLVRAFCS